LDSLCISIPGVRPSTDSYSLTALSHAVSWDFTPRVALVIALLAVVGCVEWRPEAVPTPNSRAADRLPSQARIVTGDGRELLLRDPYVQHDSLMGEVPSGRGGVPELVGVPLNEIRSLEARRPSAGRSAVLAAGIVAGMIAVFDVLLGGGS
jgi:hypothetical protein